MKNEALAKLFYKEVIKIQDLEETTLSAQISAQYRLLNLLYVEATKEEKLQFTTLFARIAFAGHKYNLSKQLQFFIHEFRKQAQTLESRKATQKVDHLILYKLGLHALTLSISSIFKQAIPGAIAEILPPEGFYQTAPSSIKGNRSFARVVAISIDRKAEMLTARDEEFPGSEIKIKYNIADRNENFNTDIEALETVFGFPAILNLLDIEIDKEEVYRPRAIVIEPDYLVDVSAIAECFKEGTTLPVAYLLKKFLPFETTIPLMLGNIANFFLDELMTNSEATFKETFPKVFRLNPLAFTLFSDREIREIMQKSQRHFLTLKQMAVQTFDENDIPPEHCLLEPSFYSQRYGIQGRLDVFYHHTNKEGKEDSAIIELKSGKAWQPNRWGLSDNHYVQTLLYDLMIKSVYAERLIPTNYILYSGAEDKPLRFAPVTKTKQFEAIHLRNQLLTIEYQLSQIQKHESVKSILHEIHPGRYPKVKGFLGRDLGKFATVYQEMNELESDYFHAFISLIAREHQLAKTGIQGIDHLNGLASLWLNGFKEKSEQFDIISHLQINKINTRADDPLIYFSKTAESGDLANFRKGDIAVLYPHEEGDNGVLNHQIFKCTIVEMTKGAITIRLRSKQYNETLFSQHQFWNLEHDLFDSGFTSMYRSIFEFVQFNEKKKGLLLTTEAPGKPQIYETHSLPRLTREQEDIFNQAIHAPDYFLLWGPPGTGKTSIMLQHFVKYIINETDENVLLLAYTNRAVDEMCEAIEGIDALMTEEYIRIGSAYSTSEKFRGQLLSEKTKKLNSRSELKELIDSRRIFVSTVASIVNKQDLLKLKKFHRVIIDEASQILEPLLVGLLPKFEQFILIGDHKQLPAVVTQDSKESATQSELLKTIGLHNLRDSLFERLFKQCQANNWNWAYAQLSHQGRMHQDLMDFPNQNFYGGLLNILPVELSAHHQQIAPLRFALPTESTELEQQLCDQRMLFIPTPSETGPHFKVNTFEAEKIAELVKSFHRIYEANGEEISLHSIGIITPYRAQIAQLQQVLQRNEIDLDLLTIDTVERYQGGARDIILISLCANQVSQLTSLVSESGEGVDRKLNVALTRARKHLVIVGNPQILKENHVYRDLIEYCAC